MTLTYRPMVEADVAAIAGVHRRACLIAYQFMNWSYTEDEVRDWYAGKFREWDWAMVAEEGTAVVVFIAASGAYVDQLFVDPGRHGRGVGGALLSAALQRQPGLITLTVFEGNTPARQFYERHGFQASGGFFNEEEDAVELVYRRDGISG